MAPFDRHAFINYQEYLLSLEANEEYERDVKYLKWTIAGMIQRKVAVANLNYASSKFISHGCREVVFHIPIAPGYVPRGQQAKRIKVRDTLRVQDFVTIRSLERPDATTFLQTLVVTPAIVSGITATHITVRLKDDAESSYVIEDFCNVLIVKHVVDDTSHRRMKYALTHLGNDTCPSVSRHIRDIIFGSNEESEANSQLDRVNEWFENMAIRNEVMGVDQNRNIMRAIVAESGDRELAAPQNVTYFNQRLDDSQKEAVSFALNQKAMSIIHGPPGTGKTTTLVEIVLQLVLRQRCRVLVCGPSNVSIDNLLKKLVSSHRLQDHQMVRLGNPTRVFDDELMRYTMDGALDRADTGRVLYDLRSKMAHQGNKVMFKRMASALKMMKRRMAKPILEKANVVLSTLVSACPKESLLSTILGQEDKLDGQKGEQPQYFDYVIIDECGQSTEMACYIAMWLGKKVILAGDHMQLPPTVLSQEANSLGLGVSLMQRLLDSGRGQAMTKMLTMQYRMNKAIMNLVSDVLYGDQLSASPVVANHLLFNLYPRLSRTDFPAVAYLNTVARDFGHESRAYLTKSLSNPLEADLIVNYAVYMKSCGVHYHNIGVITPYQDQIRVIRKMFAKRGIGEQDIEVNTVDGFQGREKEAILISFVRSNDRGSVGFLKERRRINVAITRARRHVLFVGNFGTLTHDDFMHSLFEKIQEDGMMHLCSDYMTDSKKRKQE